MFVGGEKMGGLTCAEAICELGERIAMAQEGIFNLRVVDGRQGVEDGLDLPDAMLDDVACEGDVPNRCPKQHKAALGGARDTPVERVANGRGGAAPNQRFARIERESDFPTQRLQQIERPLQVLTTADERDVIKEGDGKEVGDVGMDLEEDGMKDEGEKE